MTNKILQSANANFYFFYNINIGDQGHRGHKEHRGSEGTQGA